MPDSMSNRMPASNWKDAFPLGNGKIGALVFGRIFREKMIINHERLFDISEKPLLGSISDGMEAVRKLMLEGRYDEGEQLLKNNADKADPSKMKIDPYQPFMDMFIGFETKTMFTDYNFSLDFKTARTVVSWTEGGVCLKRETFVSYDKDIICVRISSSEKGYLNVRVNLDGGTGAKNRITWEVGTDDDFITFKASYKNGRKHGAVAYLKSESGTKWHDKNNTRVTGADTVYIFVKTYVHEDGDVSVGKIMKELKKCDYEKMYRAHVRRWKGLYGRITLDIGQKRKALSNEELLAASYNGNINKEITHTMFNYGRYLLISSSKEGGLPANLQGIWNGDYDPAWASDFHNDENIQMNYWAALQGGLKETMMPLFDYYESMIEDERDNAKRIFGARGILMPMAQTTHGLSMNTWISGAGWVAQFFYDYWLFTGDDVFLKDRAVRYLKEVALFYEDYLIMGPDGKYMFVPSYSPENTPICDHRSSTCINATMDVAIAREVLHNLITACVYLGIEKENVAKWEDMQSKMPSYKLNEDGAIKEWLRDDLKDNYYHRHQSHIYPLFPGTEITKENDPVLYKGFERAVEKRLLVGFSEQTGWSYSHMANIYARLEKGERALRCLGNVIRSCTRSNLFTCHNDWRGGGITADWFNCDPPFQIDANFGFTAAVFEMLLFSKPGFIRIIPALPESWSKGSVKGMRTRCMIGVDIEWDMEKKDLSFTLYPDEDTKVTVEVPGIYRNVEASGADTVLNTGSRYMDVVLKKGNTACIRVKL
jgi:alpha-L-fucosidase 2